MSPGSTKENPREQDEIEPYLMSVLSKKFKRITDDMTRTLLRSARSGVINVARDFSSAITLFDGRAFMIEEGLPVHLANIQFVPRYTVGNFDDISKGDAFLTNSPYAGNTHHADYTLHAPVFYNGEPLCWSISRAHQADVGAPEPSTYLANAEDIFQEGMHFPAVRIQEDYEDKEDLIRMCKLNIRSGESQWYRDYQAQISSIRKGEEKIQEMCEEYGLPLIKSFFTQWLEYGERIMKKKIAELPEADISYQTKHDPVPGAPDGVPIEVRLRIEPDNKQITVDLRGGLDNIPSGFNLSEATTVAGAYAGVFNNLDEEVPHNQGSIDRIYVEIDDGKVVGRPKYPAATATATTNVCGVLFNAVQAAFGELGEPFGMAEGASGIPPISAVISGKDTRRNQSSFINQMIHRAGGGPALFGHDGWLTYGLPVAGGVLNRDSIEIDEQKYPIIVYRNELRCDTGGAGEWRGAPGGVSEYGPIDHPIKVAYFSNGCEYPPRGILGGGSGGPAGAEKVTEDGERVELPPIGVETILPGERIIGKLAGGGGYGDPLERNPESVRQDVANGIVSKESARERYGVIVEDREGNVVLDDEATAQLRREQHLEEA